MRTSRIKAMHTSKLLYYNFWEKQIGKQPVTNQRELQPTLRQIEHFGYDLAVKAVRWTENGVCKNKNDPRFDHIRCTAIARSTGKPCRNIRNARFRQMRLPWRSQTHAGPDPLQPAAGALDQETMAAAELLRCSVPDPDHRPRRARPVRGGHQLGHPGHRPRRRPPWAWLRAAIGAGAGRCWQLGKQAREMWVHGTLIDIPQWLAEAGPRPW